MLYQLSYRLTIRMLKKASRFVLASLRTSTYQKEYASVLRSLRPRRKTFLNILRVTFWDYLSRYATSEDPRLFRMSTMAILHHTFLSRTTDQ